MRQKNLIYAQSLYDLVERKIHVNAYELITTSETIYKSIKAFGIEQTKIYFEKPDFSKGRYTGLNIPLEMRAVAAFVAKFYFRWPDSSMYRIEQYYGLPTSIENILLGNKTFLNNKNQKDLPYISIDKFISDYIS